jgi:hypothetical protein
MALTAPFCQERKRLSAQGCRFRSEIVRRGRRDDAARPRRRPRPFVPRGLWWPPWGLRRASPRPTAGSRRERHTA